MGKAVPVALLLLFATGGTAAADNLSNRFNDTFGDTPPAADAPPAAAPATAAPETAAPATDTATPLVVPKKPKPRRTPPPASPAAEDSVAAAPATPAVVAPKPPMKPVKPAKAVEAAKDPTPSNDAKPSEPIPGGYQVNITWNALDPSWEGMFVTNTGATPVSVLDVSLNNRKECTLKPYSLEKIQKLISVQDAVKQWGHEAINLFGLPKMEVDSVFVPELPAAMQSSGITPEEPKIKGGDRVAIFNGTKCDKVSEAKIDTDAGPIAVKFKRPYTGH